MFTSYLLAGSILLSQTALPESQESSEAKRSSETSASVLNVPQAVQKLVRQLNDEQLAKRESAEKELVALGPAALEHLPQINARTPAEVKDRLGRVRIILENAAIELATRPATVTLEGEMTLDQALKELERQSGNRVVDFRERFDQSATPITVTLESNGVLFWSALDQLLDKAKMTTYNFGGEMSALTVVARQQAELDRSGRAAYAGQFRIEPVQLDVVRDLRNPMNNSLQLALDIAWEPRLRPIVLSIPFDELRATDDQGNNIENDTNGGEPEVSVDANVSATEVMIPLKLPDRSVRKIASLKGKMNVLAQGRMETFEFADLDRAKDATQKRAGVTVIFEQVRKNGDVFELRMKVIYDEASNALESHRGWILDNPAFLIDPSGNRAEPDGMEVVSQSEDEIGISYKFVISGSFRGYKFIYKTAAALMQMPVEFELKEIELP